MKRPIASMMLCMFALLLLAGCKTLRNDQDVKPVSSAAPASAMACTDRCVA